MSQSWEMEKSLFPLGKFIWRAEYEQKEVKRGTGG